MIIKDFNHWEIFKSLRSKISQDENHPEYSNLTLADGKHNPKKHPMARIAYTTSVKKSNPEEI